MTLPTIAIVSFILDVCIFLGEAEPFEGEA